jgi:magnesium chelatase subunit D
MTQVLTEYHFPFAAVVGHTLAKRALLLLAIEPRLGGVIIAARPGTAKTILARSLHALLPDIEATKGCLSHCHPQKPQTWCSECRQNYMINPPQPLTMRPPFINLPLNITEDRLLGGLSLEATLQTGRRVAERGVLAEANRGVLYCDELNLLESGTGNYLMDALSRGRLMLEREGLSADYPTDFVLIGTFNPDEGEVRDGLSDRVGLMVSVLAAPDPAERVEIINRALLFDRRPELLNENFADETAILKSLIAEAREVLPQVQILDEQLMALSEIALRLGVMGNRVDLFAAWAAKASAALEGRTEINEDDLKTAVQLVLLPRATQMPAPPPEEPEEPEPPEPPEPPESEDKEDEPPENEPKQEEPQIEDLVMSALETELPADILALMQARQQRAKAGSRGETYNWKRGRHIQSVPGEPGQGRIAITATLRAAAPFQNIRKNEKPAIKRDKTPRVQVRADDLRIKRYKDKAGVLFVFVVDASGSMALNRMREAKGAVTQLLQQAYVHRDKVALIAFRGREAEVLLPPSQSVELAKRSLDVLPTGGGTPLSSALLSAFNMSESAKRQGIFKTMIVLITDGRGNVLLNEDELTATLTKDERKTRATQEVEQLAGVLAMAGMSTVVLDTQTSFLSKGEAANLAKKLGGNYIYLPRADARVIANTVSNAAETLR